MVVLIQSYGNHSNRLFQLIHFEAFCKESNQSFFNLCFDDMKKLYGVHTPLFSPFWQLVCKVLKKIHLMKIFDFSDEDDSKVSDFMNKITMGGGAVLKGGVGVHIRRGDYKFHEGGKFYYDDDIYLQNIQQIEKLLLAENKEPMFVIFSNEELSNKFYDNERYIVSNEEWFVDQFIMGKMDFLIGPPSTFTMWASYVGNVPLFMIEDKQCNISLDRFVIVDG